MRGNRTFDGTSSSRARINDADRLGGPGSRHLGRRVGAALAGLLTMVAFTAACGGASKVSPSVASVSTSATSAATASRPSSGGSAKPDALAYSQCMRAHGIAGFPDPDNNGDIQLNTDPGSDIDPNNAKFQAADSACKSLRPQPEAVPAGQMKAANVKYAQCMRTHGISDFPDPDPDGKLQVEMRPGTDLDPANPAFTTADDACKHLQLGGGEGRSTNSSGGDGS
jgi:hypothetical protein